MIKQIKRTVERNKTSEPNSVQNWNFGAYELSEIVGRETKIASNPYIQEIIKNSDESLISEQRWLAQQYKNELIEIEQNKREKKRLALLKYNKPIEVIIKYKENNSKIDKLRKEIKSIRQSDRIRTSCPDQENKIQELLDENKKLKPQVDKYYEKIKKNTKYKRDVKKINNEAKRLKKEAYARYPELYSGSKGFIIQSHEAACKTLSGPQFRRFRGQGRIGGQLYKTTKTSKGIKTTSAITINDIFSAGGDELGCKYIQICPIPLDIKFSDSNADIEKALCLARIRIGTIKEGRGKPRWKHFFVVLHKRPPFNYIIPPLEATVSNTWLNNTKIGPDNKQELTLTINSDSFIKNNIINPRKFVSIDLNWRIMPNGDGRVAYCADSFCQHFELCIPEWLIDKFRYVDSLKSILDENFNVAKKEILKFKENNSKLLPDWFLNETKYLHNLKKQYKLANMIWKLREEVLGDQSKKWWREWESERNRSGSFYDTPENVYNWLSKNCTTKELDLLVFYLECWRKQNKHLFNNSEHIRNRAIAARNNLFTCWRKELIYRYDYILIDGIDLRQLSKKANPENQDVNTRKIRGWLAPGILRQMLCEKMNYSKLECKDTTRKCHLCGYLNKKCADLILVCGGCGKEYDRDIPGSFNLLNDGLVKFRIEKVSPRQKINFDVGFKKSDKLIVESSSDEKIAMGAR